MSKKKAADVPEFKPSVWQNTNRNTCIVFSDQPKAIASIAMDTPELKIQALSPESFRRDWTLIEGYDAAVAAQKYLDSLIPRDSHVQSILEKIAMNVATDAATPAPKGAMKAAKKIATKVKAVIPEVKVPPKKKAAAAAAPAAKAKAEPKAKAAASPAGRKPKVDYSAMKIKLLKGHEGKRFNEGSIRAQCFAKITDGMTVPEYLKATKKVCEEKVAIDCLKKLADVGQKLPTIELK